MVLAMGKVHIQVMGQGWKQDGQGQGQMVQQLPKVLKKMLAEQMLDVATLKEMLEKNF